MPEGLPLAVTLTYGIHPPMFYSAQHCLNELQQLLEIYQLLGITLILQRSACKY